MWSGVLATGGDVVFYGTLDGWFKAADAKSGRALWKVKAGAGIGGAPGGIERNRRIQAQLGHMAVHLARRARVRIRGPDAGA